LKTEEFSSDEAAIKRACYLTIQCLAIREGRSNSVGEFLYRPTLLGRAKAGPTGPCFLAIGYTLGTTVEIIVHAEIAISLRRRDQVNFVNHFNILYRLRQCCRDHV
jgi:hypothetical protein